MIPTTCREQLHIGPSVYTIHQEGPTPKDLTPATRFQQYKETTVHRYMCYHCLCRNPDKHTWKWKTTGRSCRKKNAFTSRSNHFAYYLRNWPLSFHHGTNGIQRSANSLLTLVNSSSSSLQGTWEQNGQMVKQTKQTARKTKDLPIFLSTTVTQNNSFSAYFGRFKKSLDRKQQEKPVGRKSFLKAPKSRKSEEQSQQSQSNRTRCMTLVYCGTLVGIGNSMKLLCFMVQMTILYFTSHMKESFLSSRWSHAINYFNAPQRSAEPRNSPRVIEICWRETDRWIERTR